MEVKVLQRIIVKYLQVSAGVRYWEDTTVNDKEDFDGNQIPCVEDDRWCPLIELETGQILNWDKGKEAEVHYKICDDGKYILLDNKRNIVVRIDGYVPNIMCPKENGYGDYIIMDIDKNGFIQNWNPTLDEFQYNKED